MTPQIEPNPLNRANMLETRLILPYKKYFGISGIPNQPVDKMPVSARVMNNHLARSL